MIPFPVRGQIQQIVSYSDSMTSTDSLAQANYPTAKMLDTVLLNISLSTVLFDVHDSNKVLYVLVEKDSIKGVDTNTANLWKDSSVTHPVTVEFRYVLTPGFTALDDSIGQLGGFANKWITIYDSVVTNRLWQFKPLKVLPIAPMIQIRIRDTNTTNKGKRSGKWFRLKVMARRYF